MWRLPHARKLIAAPRPASHPPGAGLLTADEDLACFSEDSVGRLTMGGALAVARHARSAEETRDGHAAVQRTSGSRRPCARPYGSRRRCGGWLRAEESSLSSLDRLYSVRMIDPARFCDDRRRRMHSRGMPRAGGGRGLLAPDNLRRAWQLPHRRQSGHQCRRQQRAALRHDRETLSWASRSCSAMGASGAASMCSARTIAATISSSSSSAVRERWAS